MTAAILELTQLNPDHCGIIFMELKTAIGFIAIPKTRGFPNTVLIGALFRGKDLHAHSGQVTWKMETHTGIYGCYQELIRAELREEGSAVRVVIARRTAAIILREAVGNRGLPIAEVEFLLALSWLLN